VGVAVVTSGGCCRGDVRWVLPWRRQVGVALVTSGGSCQCQYSGNVEGFFTFQLIYQKLKVGYGICETPADFENTQLK
jgi:hypothetical protein